MKLPVSSFIIKFYARSIILKQLFIYASHSFLHKYYFLYFYMKSNNSNNNYHYGFFKGTLSTSRIREKMKAFDMYPFLKKPFYVAYK